MKDAVKRVPLIVGFAPEAVRAVSSGTPPPEGSRPQAPRVESAVTRIPKPSAVDASSSLRELLEPRAGSSVASGRILGRCVMHFATILAAGGAGSWGEKNPNAQSIVTEALLRGRSRRATRQCHVAERPPLRSQPRTPLGLHALWRQARRLRGGGMRSSRPRRLSSQRSPA